MLRYGAWRMLQQVTEAEMEAFSRGARRWRTRMPGAVWSATGPAPKREFQIGAGPIVVRRPPPQAAGVLGTTGKAPRQRRRRRQRAYPLHLEAIAPVPATNEKHRGAAAFSAAYSLTARLGPDATGHSGSTERRPAAVC
jgi:hypothetical protein